jgi:dTDP-4-amino-4,6-dideoxygalactose transaminase
LVRHLDASKIGNVIYYPRALHQQACFADLGFGTGDFPEAERAVDEVLALPIYAELGPEAQGRVIEAITTFLGAAD